MSRRVKWLENGKKDDEVESWTGCERSGE